MMRAHVIELSDDKYEGRGPASPGDEAARRLNHDLDGVAPAGASTGMTTVARMPKARAAYATPCA